MIRLPMWKRFHPHLGKVFMTGHDLTDCAKTRPIAHLVTWPRLHRLPTSEAAEKFIESRSLVTGHDFRGCGKTSSVLRFVTGHDFTGCGKTHPVSRFVTGHDFSRAANAAKSMRALAPADLDATVSPNVWSFSAASSVVP